MTTSTPRISVVMPVHNALPFLEESISSILTQTFGDFEFIILDDGSTDGSGEVLREWQKRDPRIRIYVEKEKFGLTGSSNLVVSKATAPIIARMDADDVSHPRRLELQFDVLERRADVAAVGTLCDGIDANGNPTRPRDRWRVVRRSPYIPFPHGSAMFRRKTFDAVQGYAPQFAGAEDQDIFFRMLAHGRVVTLPDVLYRYRYHCSNSTRETGEVLVRAFKDRNGANGDGVSAFYMLGAMRLWSGEPPQVLNEMLAQKDIKWNARTMVAVLTASFGNVSPAGLRLTLRTLIRARDLFAGLIVKDGNVYEWRFKS